MTHQVNIDLGWLGKVVLEELLDPIHFSVEESFKVTHDGYTESGIRVHGVIDTNTWRTYPCVWQNAILINLGRLE